MEYRDNKLGKVSLLGFGCMRFPTTASGEIIEKEAFEMLDLAYAGGVNYYDTAYPYHGGQSEPLVGKWLKTKERSAIFVATKSPVWDVNCKEDFYKIINDQLTKLQTDYIDYYMLHALNKDSWTKVKDFGVFEVMNDLKEKGLVKQIGFSFHDEFPIFEDIINAYPWDFCQIQLNYMDIEHQAGLEGYHLATKLNIPVIIMEPIKGGLLANVPSEIEALFKEAQPNWSDASWAFRWFADLPNVFTILSGMSTMEQVADNIKTFKDYYPLSEVEISIVEKAAQLFIERTKILCTECQYCMPCPFGVNIPRSFKCYNTGFIYENKPRALASYKFMSEDKRAHHCTNCGVCVPLCPQFIDIPGELKKVAEYFVE